MKRNHTEINRKSYFLFLLIFLLAVFQTSPAASADESINENDLALINEAGRLIREYGNLAWPGFDSRIIPVLLRSGEYDYLVGHPDPPKGFTEISVEGIDVYSRKGHLIPVPAATSYKVAGRWSVIIPARKEFEDWVRQKMDRPAFTISDIDYVRTVVHESFHAYQMHMTKGGKNIPDFGFTGSARETQEELRQSEAWLDEKNNSGVRLRKAFQGEKLSDVRKWLRKYFNVIEVPRNDFQGVKGFEDYIQWVEGTARYVDTGIMVEAGRGNSGAVLNYPGPDKTIKALTDQLTSNPVGPTPVRDKLAAIGAVKGFILDIIYPGWKVRLLSTGSTLDDMLQSTLGVPDSLENFPVTSIRFAGKDLFVAYADNPRHRSQGLKWVSDLRSLDGMVFGFPREVNGGFWMKDTEMSLQIGFFDQNGVLFESVVMEPCRQESCPSYSPEGPFQYVLELPVGSPFKLSQMNGSEIQLPPEIK